MSEQGQPFLQRSPLVGESRDVARFIEALRRCRHNLKVRYKVRSLGIFGSYVRNKQKKGSDLDILVEFDEVPSFIQFLQLEHYLSDLLGVSVDLVMKDALKPTIGKRILSEVVPV
jgi:predicted nucleotidyltransferase